MNNSDSEEKELTSEDHQHVINLLVRAYEQAIQKIIADEKTANALPL